VIRLFDVVRSKTWIAAFAGMTGCFRNDRYSSCESLRSFFIASS